MLKLEGNQLKQYLKYERKYGDYRRLRNSPYFPLLPNVPDIEWSFVESRMREIWQVCARILSEHGLTQQEIIQMKEKTDYWIDRDCTIEKKSSLKNAV